jgi:hypothetical protein
MATSKIPDGSGVGAGRPSVEIYRPVGKWSAFAYRVVAVADDTTGESLRAAKALALEVEQELFEELKVRLDARLEGAKRRPVSEDNGTRSDTPDE